VSAGCDLANEVVARIGDVDRLVPIHRDAARAIEPRRTPGPVSSSALTRNAGEVNLPAGTWSFYAVHASRVDCWTDTGSGNGPIDVIDAQFEWCYQ
jgi:hypothetical protein